AFIAQILAIQEIQHFARDCQFPAVEEKRFADPDVQPCVIRYAYFVAPVGQEIVAVHSLEEPGNWRPTAKTKDTAEIPCVSETITGIRVKKMPLLVIGHKRQAGLCVSEFGSQIRI